MNLDKAYLHLELMNNDLDEFRQVSWDGDYLVVRCSHGYTFKFFIDCNEFDYIEEIIGPDGEVYVPYDHFNTDFDGDGYGAVAGGTVAMSLIFWSPSPDLEKKFIYFQKKKP